MCALIDIHVLQLPFPVKKGGNCSVSLYFSFVFIINIIKTSSCLVQNRLYKISFQLHDNVVVIVIVWMGRLFIRLAALTHIQLIVWHNQYVCLKNTWLLFLIIFDYIILFMFECAAHFISGCFCWCLTRDNFNLQNTHFL